MHACGRHEASIGLERRLSVDTGATGLGLWTRGGRGPLGWEGGRGPAPGDANTFVSSRTRFCSRRARASCVSRRFLSSSSWLPSWRTSSWSCSRAFSSSRALRGQKGRGVRPSTHVSLSPQDGAARAPSPPSLPLPPSSEQLLGAFRETPDSNGAQGDPRACLTQQGRLPAAGSEAPLESQASLEHFPQARRGPFPPPDHAELQGADLGTQPPPTTDQVGSHRPEAEHSPQNAPHPLQSAGPSSALACSHTDFWSPVPSRPHQMHPHTDMPCAL